MDEQTLKKYKIELTEKEMVAMANGIAMFIQLLEAQRIVIPGGDVNAMLNALKKMRTEMGKPSLILVKS
jgi:hypothetical protein